MAKPIIDLKRSKWDTKKSDPSKGEYVFETKVYYRNRDFQEGYIHPFKLKWCKYSENDYPRPFASFNKWKLEFQAKPVVAGKDDYWPEGFPPDTNGYYVDQDLILVKIPIEVHVEKRREAIRRSEMEVKRIRKDQEAVATKMGAALTADDKSELDDWEKNILSHGV
jgi:hypothetical protein